MFEGKTTIKFSKEAAMLMMSQNVSAMFNMPLKVTAMEESYSGLELTFESPQEQVSEESETLSEDNLESEEAPIEA